VSIPGRHSECQEPLAAFAEWPRHVACGDCLLGDFQSADKVLRSVRFATTHLTLGLRQAYNASISRCIRQPRIQDRKIELLLLAQTQPPSQRCGQDAHFRSALDENTTGHIGHHQAVTIIRSSSAIMTLSTRRYFLNE
jgi:hypothetical protein